MRWFLFLFLLPNLALAQDRVQVGDDAFEVTDGKAYRLTDTGLELVADLYDVNHLARSYTTDGGTTYRIDPATGARYQTLDQLDEDFERTADVVDLMGPQSGWTALTLQSRRAPTVPDYVRLYQAIARGEAGCRDNCVAVSGDIVGAHGQALEAITVPPGWRNSVSKASLDTGLLYLRQGDRFSFSGRFFIAEGMPASLVDFEASYILEGPGLRVMLAEDGVPWVELKWGAKPNWWPAAPVRVPQGAWFNLRFDADLDRHDGQVRLWLDDQLIIDGRGQTMPLTDAVLDRMELGITAAVGGYARVLVDDVSFVRHD